ncbi:NAD(P)/FAD-dependent oxidoreductase [Clostridium sp. P21]|uniref:NAD(P)/FAD-dependent oxidoreductase n=1 Tax=Clostridium muellerianum TaxID=2716538 RepID=A0A7Y0HPG7_9CLOT|nr:NAD(P)/FAD-dependent oxidoreductase [Clostridium muellerianum]NMM63016.1 NAD(P)/FAD-dependent oxidoreductase [Clostridium muellerianum]
MENEYDIAIVGTGPAGLSAAINAKIRNKSIIVFGNKDLSSKLIKAPKINNYLGFYGITGKQLKESFEAHISNMKVNITEERVNAIYSVGNYFVLMVNNKCYEVKVVIIATGMEYTKPIKGEEEFLGRGVGYCATCDAQLYKDKVVTIIGYTKKDEEEANYVNEFASKLYYIPMYHSDYNLKSEIEIVKDKPIEISGQDKVNKLILKSSEILTDGVFVLKESVSPAQLVPGLITEGEHIKVNRDMSTNIKGCFAAGDCTGTPYQFMKAAGEGLVAALSAVSYIDSNSELY